MKSVSIAAKTERPCNPKHRLTNMPTATDFQRSIHHFQNTFTPFLQ